jgi:hypothetical protein
MLDQIWHFLVYSGASYSIFPHRSSVSPSIPLRLAPLAHLFLAGGEKEFTLSFSGHLFKWTLLLADVKFPNSRVDFLCHHKLLVDPAQNQLISATGFSSSLQNPLKVVSPIVAVPVSPASAPSHFTAAS